MDHFSRISCFFPFISRNYPFSTILLTAKATLLELYLSSISYIGFKGDVTSVRTCFIGC